jgi:hypothetical protein
MSALGTHLRRWKTAGALAGFTITAIVAATIPGVALTNASWNDTEWDYAGSGGIPGIGTENCATATNFSTRGAGKLISGTLAGTNLDAIASLNGITVKNGSGGVTVTPAGAIAAGNPESFENPLSVSALGSINLSLGSLLQLPVGANVGALNQYGEAHTNGNSAGASGVVSNSGALDLGAPGVGIPTFGTLDLQSVLHQLGLDTVSGLGDVNLTLGAVGSSEQLNGCNAIWTKDVYSNLVRNYVIASLTTNVNSPLVGDLVSSVNATTTQLTSTVNALAGNTGVINTATSGITTALGPLLSGIGLGTPTATVSASVDFGGLTTLLNTPIQDSGQIVTIDLAHGTIAIDTAKLFGGANGLNGQLPNTQLLLNTTVINNLKSAITDALNNYVDQVTAAIDAAVDAATVSLTVNIPLTIPGTGAGLGITAAANNVSLSSLEAGTAPLAVTATCSLGAILCAIPQPVLQAALDTASVAIAKAVEIPLANGIHGLVDPIVSSLTTTLDGTTGSIEAMLVDVLGGLFGQGSALSLVVNNQNLPAPGSPTPPSHPLPVWAASLAGPSTAPDGTGQYDESAIEITILGANVTLDLARSSVGSNVVTP